MSEPRLPIRLESGICVSEFTRHGPRANWKGFLRLSLVTCPVALYPATSESEKVSFNQALVPPLICTEINAVRNPLHQKATEQVDGRSSYD